MSYPLPLKIRGLGRYLPDRIVSNQELEQRMGLAAGWIKKKTGVMQRRWVTADMSASTMAAKAAAEALENACMTMDDVSLILNASGTCQRVIPDNAPLFQRELGYGASGIPGMSIHSTCLSFLSGIEVAAALLAVGQYQSILLITSDIPSRGLNFNDPESASLFGDAAAAAVLSLPGPQESGAIHAYRMETYGEGADLTTANAGTGGYPYADGSKPEEALFKMDGKRVYRFAQKYGRGFLDRLAPGFAQEMQRISAVIPHQSTLLGIHALKNHGIDLEKVVITLPDYGNCVAASIPLTLYQAVKDGRLRRGERFLLVGTGAGVSVAAALLTY